MAGVRVTLMTARNRESPDASGTSGPVPTAERSVRCRRIVRTQRPCRPRFRARRAHRTCVDDTPRVRHSRSALAGRFVNKSVVCAALLFRPIELWIRHATDRGTLRLGTSRPIAARIVKDATTEDDEGLCSGNGSRNTSRASDRACCSARFREPSVDPLLGGLEIEKGPGERLTGADVSHVGTRSCVRSGSGRREQHRCADSPR